MGLFCWFGLNMTHLLLRGMAEVYHGGWKVVKWDKLAIGGLLYSPLQFGQVWKVVLRNGGDLAPMKRNRIGMWPGAAGVLFALVAAVVLLGGWQRGRAEENSGPFVWQSYMVTKHIAHELPNHLDAVADLNSNWLYVTYWNSTIVRMNTETGVVNGVLANVYRPEWLALSPDGERLYVSRDETGGVISVIDTDSFAVVDTLPSPGNIADMVVGPNDRLYVSHRFGLDIAVSVLDTVTGELLGEVGLTPSGVYALALSPDGTVLYAQRRYSSGSEQDLVRLDVTGETPVVLLDVPVPLVLDSLELAPDGSYLLMRDLWGNLYQYQSSDLSLMRTIPLDNLGGDAVINSSGRLVSRLWYPGGSNNGPGGIQSFDATTGELVYQFIDSVTADDLYAIKRLIPLANEGMALLYHGGIRIVKPADHGLALPVIPSRHCGSSIFDDFSNPNSGWPSGQSGWTTYGYQDDQYRIHHQYANDWLGVTAGHVWNESQKLEVWGQVLDGRIGVWGIVFGLNSDWSDFYTFEIVPTHHLWYVWHYTDAAGWQLVSQGQDGVITNSGGNRIAIWAAPLMQLTVNDAILTYVPQVSGRVGITGGAIDGLLDIRYDNYTFVDANCPLPNPLLNGAEPVRVLERPGLTLPAELP
jgi:hypothetical protein